MSPNYSRLTYYLDGKKHEIESETKAMEIQLQNVEKRLTSIKHDIVLYCGILAIPYLLCEISIIMGTMSLLFSILFTIIREIVLLFSLFVIPLCAYIILKNLILLYVNRDNQNYIFENPKPRDKRIKSEKEPEKNYNIEKQKILWVLNKYYLYLDKIKELKKLLAEETISLSEEEIKTQIDDMVLYEQIRPQNGVYNKDTKKSGVIALTLIISVPLLLLLLSFFL